MSKETPADLKERTKEFALRIICLYSALPKSTLARVLGTQVLWSGTSVGAHYREARRAKSNADFISKMEGGLQELDETEYWIELIESAKVLSSACLQNLKNETGELMAIFYTIVKNAKENGGRRK